MQRLKFNKLLSHPRHGAHGMALTSGGRSQIQLSADVSLQSLVLPPQHSRLRVMLCTRQVLRAMLPSFYLFMGKTLQHYKQHPPLLCFSLFSPFSSSSHPLCGALQVNANLVTRYVLLQGKTVAAGKLLHPAHTACCTPGKHIT